MAKKPLSSRSVTPVAARGRSAPPEHSAQHKLAALAALYSVMMTASKLSRSLMALTDQVGGSLEEIAEATGIDFWDVDAAYSAGLELKNTTHRRRANLPPKNGRVKAK